MTRENDASVTLKDASSGSSAGTRPLAFFFGTRAQACPYLPDRLENKVVTDLSGPHAQALHDELTLAGFRRSHNLVYRPSCVGCEACVPVRIPVARFKPSRSQRRTQRQNEDLAVSLTPSQATFEHYALFDRYQQARHKGGGMSAMSFPDFRAMIEETPVDTRLVEMRDDHGELVAVSLSDWLADGLSGIYKFFEPDLGARSLGTYLILWHIEHARCLGLPHVYLGYWIGACSKMSYKTNFRPLEALTGDGWQDLEPDKS
ncbi:MAG: arginyltransferase [Rhodospirillales bacterium]|nr:arginyltransferase [Rhodospirillales bacterium]